MKIEQSDRVKLYFKLKIGYHWCSYCFNFSRIIIIILTNCALLTFSRYKVNILTIFRYHIFPKTNNWRITDLEWNINRWISEERAYKTYHFYKTTIRKISFNNQSFTWEIFFEKNIIISRGFSNSYFVRKKSAITKMAPQFTEFQTITLESISRSRQRICVTAQSSSKWRRGGFKCHWMENSINCISTDIILPENDYEYLSKII